VSATGRYVPGWDDSPTPPPDDGSPLRAIAAVLLTVMAMWVVGLGVWLVLRGGAS
jgi:hypothetical protein